MYIFSKPYKLKSSSAAHVRLALVFGTFAFLFLYVFQPFQLNTFNGNLLLLTAGYGLVCTCVMLFLNIVFVRFWPNFFNEETWTVGKEIGWTIVNVALIGLANALYSQQVGVMQFNLRGILYLEMYTLATAVFPVSLVVLWNESRLSKRFAKTSELLNHDLEIKHHLKTKLPSENLTTAIEIPSENAGESFTVRPENLLYMKAAENYSEIYVFEKSKLERKIVRVNLLGLEETLADNPQFFRCHKSYIVNLQNVAHISGNAQGFKLHVDFAAVQIPVSRRFNSTIKDRLQKVN